MFKNKKEIFSIRKFKNGRSDSVKIGALTFLVGAALLNASGNVYADVQTSSPNNVVENADKVSSDKSVTFIDNNDNTKKIKVDAVLNKGATEPTKANSNTGEKDGTDTLNIKAKADVNYYLEEDKSKLKDSTVVEAGTGTVSTGYDKKGLAFDTDGKSYRTSTVDKTGISVTENLGKEDIIKANGKAYKLKRTEITNKDKLHYDKTTFNNLEATVTPENVNGENGVNYSNLTGKVYIVEEVSDGVYGKFVEANNITNSESAVEAWKNGQANAKEFTKENVTLEEGDSILVLDKDTYATGTGTERVKISDVESRTSEEPVPPIDATRNINANEIITDSLYHATSSRLDSPTPLKEASSDYNLGSVRDKTVQNVSVLKYDTSVKQENKTYELSSSKHDSWDGGRSFYQDINILQHTDKLNLSKATLKDVLKDINSTSYRIAEFFSNSDSADQTLVREKKDALDTHMNEISEFIKTNDIKLGILNNEAVFYHADSSKLEELKAKIENTKTILNGLSSNDSYVDDDSTHGGSGVISRLTYDSSDPHLLKGVVKLQYHEDGYGGSADAVYIKTLVSDKTNDLTKLKLDGEVSINGKNINLTEVKTVNDSNEQFHKETETTININYTAKGVISPVRAYKVVENGNVTVNHYYDLKLEPEELKETIESKGKVVLKFVDNFGNEIKADENLVPETVIKTVKKYETKSDVTVISTREEVENNDTPYNAQDNIQKELTLNNKKYKFNSVLPVTEKYNNTTETTGNLKEGTTTIVYQYDLIVPVDPTKPNEGQTNPPQSDDKIPNDPQNRSYKDLGVLKEVKRNITYVYENGPKTGQEVSVPVNQKARFTRAAEINARTGEVTYTSDWTQGQNLNEVVSPVKDKYKADKEKVDSLSVTHESENSEVVVKYTENPDIIEHDEEKDKKGTVTVKLLDNNGNLIKEEVIKNNVIVEKATTKIYADRDPETTYTPTNEEYSTVDKKVDTFEKDGNKYKFNDILEALPEFNNTIEETGKIKEGTTTVIYLYDLILSVDPTKPNEGQTNPPQSDDKVPNDPRNRTYKDLGLIKEVTRNISYVYDDGPKANQQAFEPVNQKARFTRTAEINTRTAKITYTSEWSENKNFEEVISPVKDKYKVDKNKVDSLVVTHESENSEVIVKYTEKPDIIEHDETKDKKGTVIVKLVDINGTILKETTIKDNVIVEKATTKVYADRDSETTYTPTNEEYSIEREETITIDGLTFKLNKLIPITTGLNNSIEESGKVKEGVTNVIYEYKLALPTDSPVEESEFNGGVTPLEPPVLDVPEFNGPFGNVPNESPIHEIPEFNGGVNPIDPPIVDIPEFNGGVVPLDPPVLEIPEFNGGVSPIEPSVVETPEYNGGVVPLDPPVVEVPEFTGGVNPIDPPVLEVPEYTEPIKPVENKPVEPEKEKVLPNTNSTSILASLVSSVIGTLGLGYKSKKRK